MMDFDEGDKKGGNTSSGIGYEIFTDNKVYNSPKEMLPLVDKPAIQYVVEEAVASGIDDILIITGRGKRAIEDHFDKAFELEWILKKKKRAEVYINSTIISKYEVIGWNVWSVHLFY